MSQQNAQQPQSTDALTEALFAIIKIGLGAVLVLVFLPLAVPLLAVAVTGNRVAKRHWFWVTHRWHPWVNAAAIVIVAAALTWEGIALTGWIVSGDARAFVQTEGWPAALLGQWWPILLVNLLLGALLLPVAWAWRRRQLAELVRARKIPDVLTQEHIESARKRAADIVTARKLGLRLDSHTGALTALPGGTTIVAPHPVPSTRPRNGGGREKVTLQGIGMIERPTIRTFGDRMQDTRRVPDWTDPAGRYVVLPESAGAQRVLLFAESGSGKSVLLHDAILAVLEVGWPVFFIDAKGDPDDAEKLAAVAASRGHSVLVGEPWNLFTGTAAEITTKLMRTLPQSSGDGQFYNDEVESVLNAIQSLRPLTGMRDLFTRLSSITPEDVRDGVQFAMLTAPVDKQGTPRVFRVRDRLLLALGPLEPHLAASGWSFENRTADLTIVPLAPSDRAQATVGDLMLVDLRRYMSARLARRDKTPAVVFVDEFAQLVTDDSDPGDIAASMFETARSAGLGLWLAAQSVAGVSQDETRRRRALASGAALIVGRSKDPEDIVTFAGTAMRLESSGAATGEELRSARAQHTYVIPPDDVRRAAVGQFWIVQGGAIAPFRALPSPTIPAGAQAAPAASEPEPAAPAEDVPAEDAPAETGGSQT
ncbi:MULTISPECIES: hypothetical protein [unclassified Microbacterium]|uniref:hypothetical protein n=1 Tax=unclassified Microbacterium TaxID=2609290 RepID=UPI0022B06A20|nr:MULTISPECIES: hypothetical protein [unclassified Microbacterium]MCZ4069153.1 hypothetical protein [Microbacterium sp. H37-C3]WHE37861.1 hypothetical protein P6897_16205 [Microbacterium sp. BDGP8]